jgi:hypothetical protein
VTRPNLEYRLRSAERSRREALAGAGANERVRFSQRWETIAALSETLKAAQADRGCGGLGARPRAAIK